MDNTTLHRFELEEGGRLAYASYRRQGNIFNIFHVEAEPALRGTGAAARLMEAIAAHARVQGYKILPTCEYARAWFHRHPEATDIMR